jgi:hypothetical protein
VPGAAELADGGAGRWTGTAGDVTREWAGRSAPRGGVAPGVGFPSGRGRTAVFLWACLLRSVPTCRVGGRDALGPASWVLVLVGTGAARGVGAAVGADGGSGVAGTVGVGVGVGVGPGIGVAVGSGAIVGAGGVGVAIGAGSLVGGSGVGVAVATGDSASGGVATSASATAVSRPAGAIATGTCEPAPARPPV